MGIIYQWVNHKYLNRKKLSQETIQSNYLLNHKLSKPYKAKSRSLLRQWEVSSIKQRISHHTSINKTRLNQLLEARIIIKLTKISNPLSMTSLLKIMRCLRKWQLMITLRKSQPVISTTIIIIELATSTQATTQVQ